MSGANYNIIVAFSAKTFVIGKNNEIPWNIPEDLKRFSDLTKGSITVMGRKTYESIPENRRPLKNRINVVVTRTPQKYHSPDTNTLMYVTPDELDDCLALLSSETKKPVFIAGGAELYKKYMYFAHTIYATLIDKAYEGDVKFPVERFGFYEIDSYSPVSKSPDGVDFRFVTYKRTALKNPEYEYLDLLKDVLQFGNDRPDRTGVGTRSVFSRQLRFDISKSVPFVTTKQLAYKSVIKELLFFLKGQTDSKILEAQGVNIWRDNTSRSFLDARGLRDYREGDMGPMYFYQVFHYGHPYEGCDADYTGRGFDQMAALLDGLRNDPFSRRHLLTTYNPADVSKSVLAPCHGLTIMFYVEQQQTNNMPHLLSCHVVIRSSDTALGLPFNIASYALFTYIIAAKVGMLPKELVISTGDTHIYNNVVNDIQVQLARPPLPHPIVKLHESIKDKDLGDITLEDFEVIGYVHHPAIKMQMAV